MKEVLKMLDKDIKELNEQMTDKNEQVIIAVRRLYIQEFAEANYGRELTEAELEELTWLVWENDWELMQWLDDAIGEIMKDSEPKNKRAIIYCRTACKKQENKNLTVGQSEACLTFAEENGGFEILGVVVDDGKSGMDKNQNRLKKLFEILKAKKAEALITYDTHRISRSHQAYEDFRKLLETEGVELVTVTPDLCEIGDRVMKDYGKYKQKVKQLKKKQTPKPKRKKV